MGRATAAIRLSRTDAAFDALADARRFAQGAVDCVRAQRLARRRLARSHGVAGHESRAGRPVAARSSRSETAPRRYFSRSRSRNGGEIRPAWLDETNHERADPRIARAKRH